MLMRRRVKVCATLTHSMAGTNIQKGGTFCLCKTKVQLLSKNYKVEDT